MADEEREERQDTPQDEPTPDAEQEPTAEQPEGAEPAAEQPAAAEQPEAAEPAAEEPEAAEPAAEQSESEQPAAAEQPEPAAEQPDAPEAAGDDAPAEQPAAKPKRDRKKDSGSQPDVIPGAHLEPDLVLEDDARSEEPGYTGAEPDDVEAPAAQAPTEDAGDEEEDTTVEPLQAVLDLAADARYRATGKRKNAVASVTLKPGTGQYTINGRSLEEYFPRATLQVQAKRPLDTVGQQDKMDVVAKIHGGGVSAQAGALRHGITRALVEADPNLRGELKRRGFLTRDPRVKERKKAGLKKARKRPQFSKR